MKPAEWKRVFNRSKSPKAAGGYGLALLLVFLFSSVMVASSASLVLAPSSIFNSQGVMDQATANQMANQALYEAEQDILAQQRAGTTITTAYRFPASGTNTISVPSFPGSGVMIPKGTYYVTATYARGFTFLLKANVNVGSSNVEVSRLRQLRGLTPDPDPPNADIRFLARNNFDEVGYAVSNAGDVNNDGYEDFLISSKFSDGGGSNSGEVYLIFGRSTADWNSFFDVSGDFNLDNLSKANKTVRFIGREAGDTVGESASSAGDVNNDGYDDILLGADWADGGGSKSGEAYLIFGRSTADWDTLTDASGNFNLDNMSVANRTVRFIGRNADDEMGNSVSSAGDVNNDGYDDILLSGDLADGGGSDSGEAYLIFGRSTVDWNTLADASGNFNLDNLSKANQTVRFIGRNSGDGTAEILSRVGDVDNDGYDDFLLSAEYADGGGGDSGEAYLIFGRSTADWNTLSDASGNFNLDNMSKANRTVRFIGRNGADYMSEYVSSAGDVDNDGYDDFLIGADWAVGGGGDTGEAYLIFGRSTADWNTLTDASGNFNMDNMSIANRTVRFLGRNANDDLGDNVGNAGDVNNDGYDDILLGAPEADGGGSNAGEAYLIFGRSATDWSTFTDASGNFNLDNLSKANQTVRFIGRNASDFMGKYAVSAGDVNNDGYDDFLLGAFEADGGGTDAGEAYLIFGRSTARWATFSDASGDFNLDNI
jgi:hypothetical protein